MTQNKLPIDCIYNLRTFAFSLANETALLSYKVNDLSVLFEASNALGEVFALEIFGSYDETGASVKHKPPTKTSLALIADYVYRVKKQLPVRELLEGLPCGWQQVQDWRGVAYRFFHDLSNRSLKTEALMGVDNYGDYLNEASAFELVCATLCNLIRMDNAWHVTNECYVRTRVSELIRMQLDETYQPQPEFETWETSLFF